MWQEILQGEGAAARLQAEALQGTGVVAGCLFGNLALEVSSITAKSIVAQLEGLLLFAKLFNDPGQLDALWTNSLRLMNVAEPAASHS